MEILKQALTKFPDLPIIMITGYADVATAVSAIKTGAIDFILKPINFDQLDLIINKTLKQISLQKEVNRLRLLTKEGQVTREMFGKSRIMRSVLDAIDKIAISDNTTILIEGESGVEKEMVARYIHNISQGKKDFLLQLIVGQYQKN